jgi:hypothetical protein
MRSIQDATHLAIWAHESLAAGGFATDLGAWARAEALGAGRDGAAPHDAEVATEVPQVEVSGWDEPSVHPEVEGVTPFW